MGKSMPLLLKLFSIMLPTVPGVSAYFAVEWALTAPDST